MVIINGKFFSQSFSGVQRYSKEIAIRLVESEDFLIVAPSCIGRNELEDKHKLIRYGRLNGSLWEQIELPLYLYKKKDYLLNLGNTAPLLYHNNIITNHGLAWKFFPEAFSRKFLLWYNFIIPKLLMQSKLIITVSESAKAELIEIFKIPEDKIEVIYPGVSEYFFNSESKIDNMNKKYILYVGNIQIYKNLNTLIKAFHLTLEINNDLDLLIIGHSPNIFKRKFFIFNNNNEITLQKIKLLGFKQDNELVTYYKHAFCLVMPSLYESFGLPVLEAFACRCPVVASRLPAIQEFAKDAVLYFDPKDPIDLAAKIIELLNNPELRLRLINRGFEIAKKFTWENSVAKLKEILKFRLGL
ncbi:MAG: glycosyltransferase family 1 protein [Candidatus Aenigmatarchaeota archaeon]